MRKNGFSLLELILATFILTVTAAGIFVLFQRTLIYASVNQNKLTAYYLAQAGIENLRNQRDTNWLQGGNWNDWVNGLLPYSTDQLSLDSRTFIRTTEVVKNTNQLKVEVSVAWVERGVTSTVSVMTYFYNWYEQY